MRDFISTSDRRMGTLAGAAVAAPPGNHRRPPRRLRGAPRPLFALAGVVGITAALGSTSELAERTEDLRVLSAPEASAASLAGRPGAPSPAAYDYGRSRQFSTPDGRGYVLTSRGDRTLCLVLPDGAAPGTFGSSCARISTVARSGALGQMVLPERGTTPGRVLTAFILPSGASPDVRVTTDAGDVPVSVSAGVAVAVTSTSATLHYDVRGHARTRALGAPFKETGAAIIACRGGRRVEVTLPPVGKSTRLNTARYCR